jgi:putative endonuclease
MASPTGTLCVGVTGYFDRRVGQDKSRAIEGFTKKYACHLLVYHEIYDDAAKAIGREKQLKGGDARRKLP